VPTTIGRFIDKLYELGMCSATWTALTELHTCQYREVILHCWSPQFLHTITSNEEYLLIDSIFAFINSWIPWSSWRYAEKLGPYVPPFKGQSKSVELTQTDRVAMTSY